MPPNLPRIWKDAGEALAVTVATTAAAPASSRGLHGGSTPLPLSEVASVDHFESTRLKIYPLYLPPHRKKDMIEHVAINLAWPCA